MRVIQIASGDFFSTYGGGQVYVKNIVDEMIRQHLDVVVISSVGGASSGIVKKTYNGINLYELNDVNKPQLKKAISEIQPDVIHAHSHKTLTVSIGIELGIPVVITAHHGGIVCPVGTLLNSKDEICAVPVTHKACTQCCVKKIRGGRFWWQLARLIPEKTYINLGGFLRKMPFIPFVSPVGEVAAKQKDLQKDWKAICNGCTWMIAPSHAIKDTMVRNGLSESKVTVIPHGIPFPKKKHGFPVITDGKIKFFYIGRICYVKGMHILLEAFHRVKDPKIELHLIGGTGNRTEERYMKSLQKKYRHDTRIVWHGKVSPEKVFDEIRNFHISTTSSYLESFGLNISESLVMGRPVLATRCGGAEMQIEDGVNGWLVPTNDVEAIRTKITEILLDFSQLPFMATRIPVKPIADHCQELWDVYKSLIK